MGFFEVRFKRLGRLKIVNTITWELKRAAATKNVLAFIEQNENGLHARESFKRYKETEGAHNISYRTYARIIEELQREGFIKLEHQRGGRGGTFCLIYNE